MARGRIVIESGRIVRVEDALPSLGAPPAAAPAPLFREAIVDTVDASACLVMPGLINGHTHLWLSLLRGRLDDLSLFPWLQALAPPAGALSDDDILNATRIGVAESLKSGTTCLCECCRYAPDLAAQVAGELGTRVVVGGTPPTELFGAPVPHDYPRLVSVTRQTALAYRHGHSPVSLWLGAHSPYNCSSDFLRDAKRQATAHGYDFYIHLAECRDEVTLIQERYRKTPVQYVADLGLLDERTVAIHCVWLTEDDIALFRQSGARMAHCPVSNAKLGSGVAPVTAYRKAGIPVGLGTDSMVSNNTLSMFQEMRFAVLLQRAVRRDAAALVAADALRMATIDAARILGLDREIGSIEVGKKADLILLRLPHPGPWSRELAVSHVVYATHRDEIEAVYVEGERVVHQGRLTRDTGAMERAPMEGGRRRGRG